MRAIALEEHYAFPAFLDGPARRLKEQAPPAIRASRSSSTGFAISATERIAEMDAAEHRRAGALADLSRNRTARGCRGHGRRRQSNDVSPRLCGGIPPLFAGFATLAHRRSRLCGADELRRRVLDHGFKGVVINGHHRGRYLDDPFFCADSGARRALARPIYLHPTQPPKPVIDASYGGFAPMVSEMLAGPGWGWHIETAVHVLRIVLGGVFDKFPEPATRDRPHGRGAAVHDVAGRRHAAGDDEARHRSAPIFARTFTTHSPGSTSRRRSSTC